MPYNKIVLDSLLPDPGFSDIEELKGRESSSFPPKTALDMTAFMNVHSSISGAYRKKTDDLTFIIPYATGDKERYWCLCATIAWVLSTTTAKIILVSAENEESFEKFRNPENFKSGIALDWSQYSDPAHPHGSKSDHILSEIHLDICKKIMAGYLLMDEFNIKIHEDPIFAREVLNRISVIVVPRNPGEPFHRTKYLNMMLDQVDTEFVCNHDADTILSSHGIITSLTYLRMGTADVVYPYARSIDSQKRVFFKEASPPGPLNTSLLTGDLSPLLCEGLGILSWPASYGQSIFFKTDSYKKIGGENEEFISWAPEDAERYIRSIKLGLTVARVDAPIIHIEHPRGSDSSGNHSSYSKNIELYDRLSKLSFEELKEYYDKAEYRKSYKW